MTHALRMFLAMLAATTVGAACALAQDNGEPEQPEEADATPDVQPLVIPEGPSWSSTEIAKVGDMLKGTWKSTDVIAGRAGSPGSEIVMSIVPVRTVDIADAMYVETARTDSIHAPYRRALFQLADDAGRIVLRSLEPSTPVGREALSQLTGFWAAPDVLPLLTAANIRASDFKPTIELDVTPFKQGVGYRAATPRPFPATGVGAAEMTSEISLQPDILTTADRGLDAQGNVVWGPEPGQNYTFTRYNSPVPAVDRRDNGLLLLWYTKSEEAPLLDDPFRYYAQYSAWIAGGPALDSSRTRVPVKPGGPFGFKLIKHVTLPTIKAWKQTFRGVGNRSAVRMLAPPELAYGAKGVKRKGEQVVPPNAPLVFEVEIVGVEPARKPEPQPLPEGVRIRPGTKGAPKGD